MSIDWSKAPEGTTGAMVAHFNGENTRWGDVEFIPSDEPDRFVYDEGPDAWVYHEAPHVLPKPAIEWTGEGLPPVGTVCEVLWNESRKEYLRTKVFGVNEHGQPIHRFDEGPKKFEYQADVLVTALGTKVFRPLRTAEQIAAEKRKTAVEEMVYGACGCEPDGGNTSAFVLCGLLYDAGYRKQEAAQ